MIDYFVLDHCDIKMREGRRGAIGKCEIKSGPLQLHVIGWDRGRTNRLDSFQSTTALTKMFPLCCPTYDRSCLFKFSFYMLRQTSQEGITNMQDHFCGMKLA